MNNMCDSQSLKLKLAKYSVYVLDSVLRSSSFKEDIEQFFKSNSPRFRNFSNEVAMLRDLDIQMTNVHLEFLAVIESKFGAVLSDMEVSYQAFLDVMQTNLAHNNDVAIDLYQSVSKFYDFEHFGRLMEEKYHYYYGTEMGSASGDKSHQIKNSIKLLTNGSTCVRVLWDIENIKIAKSSSGMEAMLQLNEFLRNRSLLGPGIDTRVTAFFSPSNTSITPTMIEDLDKAAVELVWVSKKREDADRKLGMRINQEMLVLNPNVTTFVIMSSDQDFRHHVQLLTNTGYHTIMVHDANNEKWKQCLELHASESYQWRDILSGRASNSSSVILPGERERENPLRRVDNINTRTSNSEEVSAIVSLNTSSSNNSNSAAIGSFPPSQSKTASASPRGGDGPRKVPPVPSSQHLPDDRTFSKLSKEEQICGWRLGICLRWKAAYGFILVDITLPVANENFTLVPAAATMSNSNDSENAYISRLRAAMARPIAYYKDTSPGDGEEGDEEDEEHQQCGFGASHGRGANSDSGTMMRVFVHYRSIASYSFKRNESDEATPVDEPESRAVLSRGEIVLAKVELSGKGPRATFVRRLCPPAPLTRPTR